MFCTFFVGPKCRVLLEWFFSERVFWGFARSSILEVAVSSVGQQFYCWCVEQDSFLTISGFNVFMWSRWKEMLLQIQSTKLFQILLNSSTPLNSLASFCDSLQHKRTFVDLWLVFWSISELNQIVLWKQNCPRTRDATSAVGSFEPWSWYRPAFADIQVSSSTSMPSSYNSPCLKSYTQTRFKIRF